MSDDTWSGEGDWEYQPRRRLDWPDVIYIVSAAVILAVFAVSLLWPDLLSRIVSAPRP